MHTRCAQPGLDSFWLLQQEEKKNGSDTSFEFKVSLSDQKKKGKKKLYPSENSVLVLERKSRNSALWFSLESTTIEFLHS